MKISEILAEGRVKTLSYGNAVEKLKIGYQQGLSTEHDSCYGYVGNWLKNNPELAKDAVIRFWGIKRADLATSTVVHGDAILPNGKIISDIDPVKYSKGQAEIVHTLTIDDLENT